MFVVGMWGPGDETQQSTISPLMIKCYVRHLDTRLYERQVWTCTDGRVKWMKSDLKKLLPSPLLSSILVPWRRWMRQWCGRRSCPRWTPHRCPSSPRPPPRTARPCPPSAGAANCWAAARGEAVAMAGPPAHPPPPLPSQWRPGGGRWRAAAPAGWTGSIPGRGRVEGDRREHQWR